MDDQTEQTYASRYESDFYTWTQEQALLLKEGHASRLDVANLVEELETLGRSELGTLVSAYKLVSQHLLKLMLQPDKATDSWANTIRRERGTIEDIIEDSPGLKPKRDEAFAKGYARGRRDAAHETGIELARFPQDPPFDRVQAESDFWPGGF